MAPQGATWTCSPLVREPSESDGGTDSDSEQARLAAELASQIEFRAAIERSLSAGIATVDLEGRQTYVNDTFCRLVGWTPEELIGKTPPFVYWPPEEVATITQRLKGMLSGSSETHFEVRLRRRSGERFDAQLALSPLLDAARTRIGWLASVSDVTARNREQRALRTALERWELAVDATHDGIWDWDLVSGQLHWSPRAGEMLGLGNDQRPRTPEEVRELIHPEDRDRSWESTVAHLEGRAPHFQLEYRLLHRDGSYRWILCRGRALRDEAGSPTRMIGAHTDITDRKQAEATLQASERRFRVLADAAPVMIWLCDAANRGMWYNRPWLEFRGRTLEEELGEGWLDGIHPEDRERCARTCGEAFAARGAFTMEFRFLRHDGTYRWVLDTGQPLCDTQGCFEGYIGSTIDVTELKQAEQKLRESQKRAEADHARSIELLESIRDAFYAVDADFRFTYLNREAEQLWGRRREELIGRHLWTEFPAAVGGESYHRHQQVMAHRQPVRYETHSAIVGRWIDVSIYPEAGGGLSCFFRDIAERKAAEEERRRAAERIARLHGVAASLSEALTIKDVARVAVEQGIAAMGASAGSLALVSEDGSALELAGHVGYGPEVMEPWQRFPLDTPVPLCDAVHSGEAIYLESPQERLARYPALAQVKARHETHSSACIPLTIGSRTVGVLGLSFDQPGSLGLDDRQFMVSLARQCAQALERARLYEAERHARTASERASKAKDEFLATLSHELRTPLTPVLLTVSLIESHPALPQELREDVATIRRNVELESRLISDLLDLTRISSGKLQLDEQDVDLHLIIRSAVDICQREASANLRLELTAEAHTVCGDSTRLQQVFWNLINNAIKFTPLDGVITVRSSTGLESTVVVEVTDTGIGIEADTLPRLFDAFEQGNARALGPNVGLGLGLAISKRLVEAHGGTISASSGGPGTGATFRVALPTVAAMIAVPPVAAPPRRVQEVASMSVLVVEDHEPTLRVMCKLLRGLGHEVATAGSATSAIAAARQRQFDLMISDLGLPDGSGLDVIRQIGPSYVGRAIALTGYGMESDVNASLAAGFSEHLTKPVDLAGLEAVIARVVAAAEARSRLAADDAQAAHS